MTESGPSDELVEAAHQMFDLARQGEADVLMAHVDAGVPADLTRAALRRVWTVDPAIRDFVGLAENAWDFTDPNAMPGFGPLEASDDVSRPADSRRRSVP